MSLANLAFLSLTSLAGSGPIPEAGLRCLIVGGGPVPSSNQYAIESNVRYVESLLPTETETTVLFADGNAETATVQAISKKPPTETAILGLLEGYYSDGPPFHEYRKRSLTHCDGPSTAVSIGKVFDGLAAEEGSNPLMLYFTGHGSPGTQMVEGKRKKYLENNSFALWNTKDKLAPKQLLTTDLAKELVKLPAARPVTLVMVQCYSGSFSNLLFGGGKPNGEMLERPICGFFASVKERSAAGCTAEVDEENYHDFTSYFFAALTGKDRLGRKNPEPDYNADGKVSMDEAFGWTQINDDSIDVPVSTSDAFLRRFGPALNEEALKAVPWHLVRKAANPIQTAVLNSLCEKLGKDAQTDDRVAVIYKRYKAIMAQPHSGGSWPTGLAPRMALIKLSLTEKYPDIKTGKVPADRYAALAKAAKAYNDDPSKLADLNQVWSEMATFRKKLASEQVDEARWLRLEWTVRSVILEMRLRQAGDSHRLGQLDRLRKLEAGNPFRP